MDVSDIDNKPAETTQEEAEEPIAVDDLVREDHENSEELDEGLDPVAETEPSLDSTKPVKSLSEELTQVTEDPVENDQQFSLGEANGVSEAVTDSVSKETDSVPGQNVPGQNGYSDPTPSQAPDDRVDPALAKDSVITSVPKPVDVGESDVPQVPHSTENQVGEILLLTSGVPFVLFALN